MRTFLVLSCLAAAAPAAYADDTFEAKAAGAQRIRRIDDIVWALTASCSAGTDPQQRQCRRVRDARAAELANATLLVEGDREAFVVGAWNAQKKSAPVTMTTCIRCAGVRLDGMTWFIVANKDGSPPPRFEGAKLRAGRLLDTAKGFADAAAAKQFAASAKQSKVELVVKVPAQPKWNADGKQGLALDVLAYRVVSPCDGSVVYASPKSGPAEVDRRACSALAASGDPVAELTPDMIKRTMRAALDDVKDCYAKYKVSGNAKLKLAVAADGSISEYEQEGDFASTPTGTCIDAAVEATQFRRSGKARTAITIPISLP